MAKIVSITKILLFCLAFLVLFVIINFHSTVQIGMAAYYNEYHKLTLCTNASNGQRPIPMFIHQILLNEEEKEAGATESRRFLEEVRIGKHQDFKYILWNSTMIETLLNDSYPTMRHTYEKHQENPEVLRHISRYMVVHATGGMFVDWDFEFSQSLAELCWKLGENQALFLYTERSLRIRNDLFMAGKGNDFIAHALRAIQEVDSMYPRTFVNYKTAIESELFLMERDWGYPKKQDVCLLSRIDDDHGLIRLDQYAFEFNGHFVAVHWQIVYTVEVISLVLMFILVLKFESLVQMHIKFNNATFRRVELLSLADIKSLNIRYENV